MMLRFPQGMRHYPNLFDRALRCYDAVLRHSPTFALPWRKAKCRVSLSVGETFYVRLGSSDFQVIEEVWLRGEYDAVLRRDIGVVHQILDLGCNIGATLRFWQRNFPSAAICAVEPDRDNLALAKDNAAGGSVVITWVHGCVAAAAGFVSLNRTASEWSYRMQPLAKGTADAARVQAFTVLDICQLWGNSPEIDLLKCDIEGAEQDLFGRCEGWISRVRNLLVELHHPYSLAQLCADLERGNAHFASVETVGVGEGYEVVLLTGNTATTG